MMNWVRVWLVSAVAYYLAGLFGLQLAIPPGFASAVWPASGVALALAVRFCLTGVILGTFTASFLLNLNVSTSGFTQFSLSQCLLPAEIALGASLQLWLGYILFERLLGRDSLIDTPKSILRFALIIAPASCLIAATFGAFGLYHNDVIPIEVAGFTWLTWWLGDTIGVFLFTPMVLLIFTNRAQVKAYRKWQVIAPSSMIFIITWMLFVWSTNTREQTIEREIDDIADRFTQRIEERLLISSNKLLAYQAYFKGSEYISYDEFSMFSKLLLDSDDVLFAVGWTEITPHYLRRQQESRLRQQGYSTFEFIQRNDDGSFSRAKDKDEYYPVLYIYPYETNKRALGLDLASLPGRLELLRLIQLDGKGRATKPITLVQEKEEERAVILYLPVWQMHNNIKVYQGYVSGVYRISGIMGDVLEQAQKVHMSIKISDITNKDKPYELIQTILDNSTFYESVVREVIFQDRTYELKFQPFSDFNVKSKDWVSWIILICGFFISALLQTFILMITGAVEHTSQIVKQRTQQLTQAMKHAEQANEAKSKFLANMSHEFRTPLNAIIGLINLCLKTNLSITQKQYLAQSKLATETLMSLINQSLDYAKIESGKLELESIEFKLEDIVKKIHAIFSTQYKEKSVSFEFKSHTSLPKYLVGDALRLEQVLLNLCSNAFKFTSEGEVIVTIDLRSEDADFYHMYFSVKDTGIGISKEQQENLFQSFRQADNSTTRKFGGTGLGLAISKQLIELMGGSITLNSELDKGCEFEIQVPLAKSDKQVWCTLDDMLVLESEAQASEEKTTGKASNQLQGLTVLLVEDIEINRMIATELLEEQGAKVIPAHDGQHGMDVLQEYASSIDVVLMDIQMPIMDGYEAARKIREKSEFASLPILAMTANAMAEDIEQSMQAGMNGHIAKPIDEENMIHSILQVL